MVNIIHQNCIFNLVQREPIQPYFCWTEYNLLLDLRRKTPHTFKWWRSRIIKFYLHYYDFFEECEFSNHFFLYSTGNILFRDWRRNIVHYLLMFVFSYKNAGHFHEPFFLLALSFFFFFFLRRCQKGWVVSVIC